MESKRFVVEEKCHVSGGILKVIVDKKTGVHYLVGSGFGVSGMTPLLDTEGRVIIKK